MKLTQKQQEDLAQEWFENFLRDHHYDLHPMILDDDLPDSYDNWISSLTEKEVHELSKEWHKMQQGWVASEFIKRNF